MRLTIKKPQDIAKINPEIRTIHLSRPLKATHMDILLRKHIDSISMSQSTYDRLSNKTKQKLSESPLRVYVQNISQGRALETPVEKIAKITELKLEGLTIREIAEELGISKSSVHYLLKYAKRNKIKLNRNRIIYVQTENTV